MEKKIGDFNGEKVAGWRNFTTVFESVCQSKEWDGATEETLVELLSSRLIGKARGAWVEWVQDEPGIMQDNVGVKERFPERLGKESNPWKILVDFHKMHMRESTPIGEYSRMYMELDVAAKADMDGCCYEMRVVRR